MRSADPHRALLRALAARYPRLEVLASTADPWASATFTGARHSLTCAPGADLTGIEEEEFALPGHIVADVTVRIEAAGCVVEMLTIESA